VWHVSLCEGDVLALCNMRTLSPERPRRGRRAPGATRDATSVSAVAARELAEASRRADNPALLGSLPDLGIDVVTILYDVDVERAER
jgi:hypothetical protein